MPLEFSWQDPAVIVTVPLVTLDEAKAHLHLTGTDADADLTLKLAAAQDDILAKLGAAGDATWTPTTAPFWLKNLILLLLGAIYMNRGDDEAQERLRKALHAIDSFLAHRRDPALA